MTKFLREKECKELTGLSRMTRWRLIKAGQFPKPIKMGISHNTWLESDIQDWIKSKIEGQ